MDHEEVPVIDIFSGPGGLSEGFVRFGERAWSDELKAELSERTWKDPKGLRFKIGLSIEKDPVAHQTLTLRAFVRQFPDGKIPDAYYKMLKGDLVIADLFNKFPEEASRAKAEAWHHELADDPKNQKLVDERIEAALAGAENWCLIGGPPCQAYSLVGRARNKGKKDYVPEDDVRHFLYKEYLRIVAKHEPTVFVMENVKGILSSKINGKRIFEKIMEDLANPSRFGKPKSSELRYEIVPLVVEEEEDAQPRLLTETEKRRWMKDGRQFILRAEELGIPQARHRVILLGIRGDSVPKKFPHLTRRKPANIEEVLAGLPTLRATVSKRTRTDQTWLGALKAIRNEKWFLMLWSKDFALATQINTALLDLSEKGDAGKDTLTPTPGQPKYMSDWYTDPKLEGVTNHRARSHMASDLQRYFFAANFAELHKRSPTLEDFPKDLLPNHKNAALATEESAVFNDRFRVQSRGRPATTITSHISKDGHYYIHPDKKQCRALTVREAARIQTFPDNYFFCGSRTEQYHQVGNAVPPLLAVQIASAIAQVLREKKQSAESTELRESKRNARDTG